MDFLNNKKTWIHIACLCLLLAGALPVAAQLQPELRGPNAAKRYEINAKRTGTSMFSEDALPRSREFKRIDSTYYVGWMYEGVYKYDHAADYLGFKHASVPLERALDLIERDFKPELRTRTSDIIKYYPVYFYHYEYTTIAYFLMMCYNNMEEPMKTNALLRRVLKWNFQKDYFNMDVYNHLAWNVHRYRYYTSEKYPFLKNSIDANEQLANRYLDSQLRRIAINKRLNSEIFRPGYEQGERMSVYHYKSILYSYALKIDSAAYYYNLMKNSPIFPHNNYATFRTICGDFREAEKEYDAAVEQDAGDKRLKEWAYYTTTLDIYKAQPEKGIELMKDMIKANGSTPGFGWYNIALARAEFYNGKVSESERYIKKAAEFKELHIGTTLSQQHYDFSTQMIKLLNINAEIEQNKFENSNWWYNPKALAKIAKATADKYTQQFLIINQFAQNPERDRVVYKLFSTESTISWDEVWYLIRDFSTRYFITRFEHEVQTDERRYIRKYFKYFIARLNMKLDNYKEARIMLDEILRDPDIDVEYEKLFLARVYQAQAECAEEQDDDAAYAKWMMKMYAEYPQLIPYTGLKMNMELHVNGNDGTVIRRLRDCNINWTTGKETPRAFVTITNNGKKGQVKYYVLDSKGKYIVPESTFGYDNNEAAAANAGINLAYRLFNIGESPAVEPRKVNKE
ncbi:MAG: hypothetical protein KDC07_00790 [Chitinophagaceae bacterium]|nr:hypothetical protein [Chitinophagaceae bacterium]MCB9044626.1 hypothetical protein [Chitinophagales bacterium]